MSFFSGRRQNESQTTDKPEPNQSPIGFETVMGASSVLEGTFKAEGNVRLDGVFTGTLDITGNVLVGEQAQINADIEARNISIAGEVRGNVTGHKVQLLRTGRIWGDIHAASLTTEDGAFIDGKISMREETSALTETAEVAEVDDPTLPAMNRDELQTRLHDVPAIDESDNDDEE